MKHTQRILYELIALYLLTIVWRKFIKQATVVMLFWRSAWKLSVNDDASQVLYFFIEFCWNWRNVLTLYLCRTCGSLLFQDSNSDYIHFCLSCCTDFQNAWHSWVEEWVCLCVFSYIFCINLITYEYYAFHTWKAKSTNVHWVRYSLCANETEWWALKGFLFGSLFLR